MATQNQQQQQQGTIPENLKELLARTANDYNWCPQKLASIENGLKKQNWSPEQLGNLQKAINDNHWTPKEIVDIEKAHRQQNKFRTSSVNHPNLGSNINNPDKSFITGGFSGNRRNLGTNLSGNFSSDRFNPNSATFGFIDPNIGKPIRERKLNSDFFADHSNSKLVGLSQFELDLHCKF
ncbi:hypothetical protein VNO77_12662 [Canavalia gladiata]|uniref:Uncharacterized protein n=1 Tax=Canavalia gladiata TaxID=3824 RepID=A0AAN9M1T1_CANGL